MLTGNEVQLPSESNTFEEKEFTRVMYLNLGKYGM